MKKLNAFTLAEVLITLGVIGIVASMTLPALTTQYTNSVVETRLKKFYSNINQAVVRAESDYGDRQYWYQDTNSVDRDQQGNIIQGSSTAEKWFNKYLAPYITLLNIDYDDSGLPIFYFMDGSALKAVQPANMRDWVYFVNAPDKCIKQNKTLGDALGKCAFYFIYMPGGDNAGGDQKSAVWKFHYKKGFEPYKYSWEGTRATLFNGSYSGCNENKRSYCTALIQYNGWKIPSDYPMKVSY